MPSLRPALTLGALACATALALAGCSPQVPSSTTAPESSAASAPGESTAPSGAASNGAESNGETAAPSDAPDGSASSEESGGSEGGSTERWPAAVPVPPGSELGRASEGGVIAVSYEVADESAIDAYVAEVEAAGFTRVEGIPETEGVTTAVLQDGEHDVTIVGASMGGQTQLQVTVAPHVG